MALNERLLKWAECEHEMKKFGKNKKKEGSEHYRKMIGLPPREEKAKDAKRKVHPKADTAGREANGAGDPQAD